jgi:hypothetical protein
MQYLLMIYGNEAAMEAAEASARQAVQMAYEEFTDSIVKSGHFRAGDALQPTRNGATIRTKDGKLVTTDGPFAETKEQLAGYYMIEASSLDEAVGIAGRIPAARGAGCVEVRPIRVIPRTKA